MKYLTQVLNNSLTQGLQNLISNIRTAQDSSLRNKFMC